MSTVDVRTTRRRRNRSVVLSGGCFAGKPEQVRDQQNQPDGGGKKGHHGNGQSDRAGVRGDEHGQSGEDADEAGQPAEDVVPWCRTIMAEKRRVLIAPSM